MRVLIFGSATSEGLHAAGVNNQISGGGWVENLVRSLSTQPIELFVGCFAPNTQTVVSSVKNGVTYIVLPVKGKTLDDCTPQMVEGLKEMLSISSPDVVHIIGTEREYDLKLLELAGTKKTVVSTTGILSRIVDHYFAGIPKYKFAFLTVGDLIRVGGPINEWRRFRKNAAYEKELFSKVKYVLGRTTWDYACVKELNPGINYTYCSEILNPLYYENRWEADRAIPYRIFMSQGAYPLKGLHHALVSLSTLLKEFPETTLHIAGNHLLKNDQLIDRIKRGTYARYIQKEIKRLKIPDDRVVFTGPLDANGMLREYLSANVFIMPSSIENSPNSLGEAMLLGMPCIASFVGGIPDMIADKSSGILYASDEPYMLAHYIRYIFKNKATALKYGERARFMASKRFDVSSTVNTTMHTYKWIYDRDDSHEKQREM